MGARLSFKSPESIGGDNNNNNNDTTVGGIIGGWVSRDATVVCEIHLCSCVYF